MGFLDRFRRTTSTERSDEPAFPKSASTSTTSNWDGDPKPASTSTTSNWDGDPNYVSVYLHSSNWEELLVLDTNGMPPFYFKEHKGNYWLAENSTGLLVNVANRALKRLGLWTCNIRGIDHSPGEIVVGPAALVREPDNEHDKSAVAIHQKGQRIGYYNRGMAPALARAMDAGTKFSGYVVSVSPPKIIAADALVLDWLKRKVG